MVAHSETPRFPWGALCEGPQQRTQEMMSLPGNRTQQNPEPRDPGTTARGDPSQITCCQDVLLFAPAQRPGPREGSQAECVGSLATLAQGPPRRPLALCPKEQEGNPGAPGRARPPLPSHPGNPESFPWEWGRGVLGVCLPQASPEGCAVRSLCTGGVPTPGESRLGGRGRAQAALTAQVDLTP